MWKWIQFDDFKGVNHGYVVKFSSIDERLKKLKETISVWEKAPILQYSRFINRHAQSGWVLFSVVRLGDYSLSNNKLLLTFQRPIQERLQSEGRGRGGGGRGRGRGRSHKNRREEIKN